ncbi:sporulation sigma-E factor-processing peptidase [Clostridia bacterium]|nr:sporulation sigma-E factor-processing peptidase [Clostridia bacterium]
MTVYIEYFLAYNLSLDLLISVFTLRILRLAAKPWRVLLAAAAGTAAAALYPFLRVPAVPMLLIKCGAAGAAVFLLYAFKSVRKYFAAYVAFIFVTFLFGGAAYAFLNLPFDIFGNLRPDGKDAAIAAACAAAFVGYFLISFVKRLHKTRDTAGFMRKISVFIDGKRADLNAFLDTGNQLYDPVSGLPVVLIERAAFCQLFGSDRKTNRDSPFSAFGFRLPKGRSIDLSTAAGRGKIFIFKPDKILIYSDKGANTIVDVTVGLYEGTLSKTGEYAGLLHPALF